MRRVVTAAVGLFGAVLFAGCGGDGPRLAKVSGVVTLDGKPFANGFVNFQPIGSANNPNPGPGSVGRTDEQGRYRLFTDQYGEGAVVATHRVRITIVPGHGVKDSEVDKLGTPDDAPGAGQKGSGMELDPIPLEWNENSKVDFEVKPGDNTADFHIVTKKEKGKK